MWIKPAFAALIAIWLPVWAAGQSPMSAIDWLDQAAPGGAALLEPPVAESAVNPSIQVQPLVSLAEPVGLVAASASGLPPDLWRGSDANVIAALIRDVPVRRSPAMRDLLYAVLLSESRPPSGAGRGGSGSGSGGDDVMLARIDRLADLGAADPAHSLAALAAIRTDPAFFRRWFDTGLLIGEDSDPCAVLTVTPGLMQDYSARIYCGMRAGDWRTSALLLENAHALSLLPPLRLALLDRFLSPEVFEDAPPLPPPDDPDALTFRLFEAIGERLPTAPLPTAFANADLRDVAGWKAQLEAAERLTAAGALPANRLLGLYTERLPAASGGIWDRVEALQRFDTALSAGSAEAIAKTLPSVWQEMRKADLDIAFASLFAAPLAQVALADQRARQIVDQVLLLSPEYERIASRPGADPFLAALALGQPGSAPAPGAMSQAIADGFERNIQLPARLSDALTGGRVGEAILLAIARFDSGHRGNPQDLTVALSALLRLGLEDSARRAALQLLLAGGA